LENRQLIGCLFFVIKSLKASSTLSFSQKRGHSNQEAFLGESLSDKI
jgi:hypothetical protein